MTPLTASLRRLHLTVSTTFLEKLGRARDGLSNARPSATSEAVLERALDLLLQAQARKHGQVKRPRKQRRLSRGAHIPAEVKRDVAERDGGCCSWVMPGGGICGSKRRLEFDHIIPLARGGTSTVENVRLVCRFHNQVSARKELGESFMEQFTGPFAREPVCESGVAAGDRPGGRRCAIRGRELPNPRSSPNENASIRASRSHVASVSPRR